MSALVRAARRACIVLRAVCATACAASSTRDDAVPAISERLCVPSGAEVRATLYLTPADAPTECVGVRLIGVVPDRATVHALSCDRVGLTADGERIESPIAGTDATVEGTAAYGAAGELAFDLRVTIASDDPLRVVRAAGSVGGGLASDSGCYARPTMRP